MNTQARAGFGLMEILIVIAIMGLIAAIALPRLTGSLEKARTDTTRASLKSIQTALQTVNLHTSQYPEQLKDLISQKAPTEEMAQNWSGPYLDKVALNDAWGRKFIYKLTPGESEHPYELYSEGPKGKGAPKEERISAWR
ncbi:MAG TPA: type II secretion system major pseudopilin GspG [Candidatus Babeliales bacterium]|nr:type II secretion system major pseudopilin GspG [Candidatus Babeliales bacterium]